MSEAGGSERHLELLMAQEGQGWSEGLVDTAVPGSQSRPVFAGSASGEVVVQISLDEEDLQCGPRHPCLG